MAEPNASQVERCSNCAKARHEVHCLVQMPFPETRPGYLICDECVEVLVDCVNEYRYVVPQDARPLGTLVHLSDATAQALELTDITAGAICRKGGVHLHSGMSVRELALGLSRGLSARQEELKRNEPVHST